MKILVTGSTGLVGSELIPLLSSQGHEVLRLVRGRKKIPHLEILWDPATGSIEREALEGLDAVIHLAGENIAEGRWSEAKKARIRDSRVKGTKLLADSLGRVSQPPKALVSASAIGFYGDRGEEVLKEDSAPGTGFLPEVCIHWEGAAARAAEKGIRVVHPRIGVVLSPKGGALKKMLPPFRMGAGGVVGDGRQYMSWIALDELARVLLFCVTQENLSGPVNAVAPQPVTNREFTKTLGKVLSRPTIFPLPAFAARLAFGEMADALLLASSRVVPARLEHSGYAFEQPSLEGALRSQLGR